MSRKFICATVLIIGIVIPAVSSATLDGVTPFAFKWWDDRGGVWKAVYSNEAAKFCYVSQPRNCAGPANACEIWHIDQSVENVGKIHIFFDSDDHLGDFGEEEDWWGEYWDPDDTDWYDMDDYYDETDLPAPDGWRFEILETEMDWLDYDSDDYVVRFWWGAGDYYTELRTGNC